MNYIKQLNALYDWLQSNRLSSSAQLLYHTLLMINNRCGWTEWFERTNQSLCGLIGIDEKTLIRARNELKQKGLIDFKSGSKKGEITRYKIIDLTSAGEKTVEISPNECLDGKNPAKPPAKPPVEPPVKPPVEPPDIYKLKLKQKQKNNDVVVDIDEPSNFQTDKKLKKVVHLFENSGFGTINTTIADTLKDFAKNYSFELIEEAFRRARQNHAVSLRYVETMLIAWKEQGIETLEQLKEFEKKRSLYKGGGKSGKSQGNSWGNDEQYKGIGITI